MRREVIMPRMGQSMEEGRVVTWLKEVGDDVERGEAIAEIETDKATVEMESFHTGTLIEIVVPEGETVDTGTVIAIVDDGQPEPVNKTETRAKAGPPAQRSQTSTPASRDGQRSGVRASPVARRLAQEHDVDLARIDGSGAQGSITRADVEAWLDRERAEGERIRATPVARRLVREHDLDLADIDGSGPGGAVVKADVDAWIAELAEPAPDTERIELSRIKQATARRMVASKTTIPHFYISMDVEMDRALALRDWLQARGVDVTVNDLILRAATLALQKYPTLNATYADDELHLHRHVDLAVAVALDDGLITPVVHSCENRSLIELAAAAADVIARARAGRLRAGDLEGGTFTVSNLGMFGVKQFDAIVNPPQAAILACGEVRREPVFDEHDRVRPVRRLTLTLSADHRVTDGAEAARFLQELKTILEDGFALVAEIDGLPAGEGGAYPMT